MPNFETATIKNRGMHWSIAADIHFPPNFDASQQYPAVVIAHPIGARKEQTSGGVYAPKLAAAGFITVAFDASFQGASGGEPRYIEDPSLRVADFSHVADYLAALPYVDLDRLGVLGICGGGGYAVRAAMTDRRYKAIATVTGANYGRYVREGAGSASAVLDQLEQVAAQRTAEARGAEYQVDGGMPTLEQAKEWGISDVDALNGIEYYGTERACQPNTNFTLRSRMGAAYGWDAFHLAELLLTQPLLVVVGGIPGGVGAYRDGHELVRRARSAQKELVVLAGTSHFDLYDQPEHVARAMDKLAPFFTQQLAAH